MREFDFTDETAFIILACDGLWDKMSNEEACEFVRKKLEGGANLKSTAEALCQEAYTKGSQDNISAIIVGFRNSKPGSLAAPPPPVAASEPADTPALEDESKRSARSKSGAKRLKQKEAEAVIDAREVSDK